MRMSGVQFHQLTISKIISDTTTQNHQKPNILDRILKDDYRLTKFECTITLNMKRPPTRKTYELSSILRRLKTNTTAEDQQINQR